MTVRRVNKDRLWQTLMTHAEIGLQPSGGVCREALTDPDKQGRDLFVQWCRDAGLEISIDQVGTIFATRSGTDPSLNAVAIGSHLDTQPTGGKFDGTLGVLGGLEVMRALNDAEIETRRPITLVNWTNEEGSRFQPAMLASAVFVGAVTMDRISAIQDRQGKGFLNELNRIGYAGKEIVGHRKFHSYLELHIEQGPVLEQHGKQIGVVTGGQAMSTNHITVLGRESHAGTTPMAVRLDAMAAANRLIETCFRLGNTVQDARATVGIIRAEPASHNTIPHTVYFSLDMRHPDDTELARMLSELDLAIQAECDLGFKVTRDEFGNTATVTFDAHCIAVVRNAADAMGYTHHQMISGAGHDAVYLSRVCPTSMIFTPCSGGLSHNPAERISPDDAKAGADVLLGAVIELAG